jgi:hypothetical protein
MPRYYFNVELGGDGENEDDAWEDAVDTFAIDPGETPVDFTIEMDDEE